MPGKSIQFIYHGPGARKNARASLRVGRDGRPVYYLNKEYKIFKEKIAQLAIQACTVNRASPFRIVDKGSQYSITIHIHQEGYRSDIDAYLSGILDGLQGVVYENDKQVNTLIVSKKPGPLKFIRVIVGCDGVKEGNNA